MDFIEEHVVVSKGVIFAYSQSAVGAQFERVHGELRARAFELDDDELLATDPRRWAEHLAEELAIAAPSLSQDHEFVSEGRLDIDVAGWPNITYSLSEGRPRRPGHTFRVTVHGSGNLLLLQSRLVGGGTGRRVDLEASRITRIYRWPRVWPAQDLQENVDRFLADLRSGAAEIVSEVERRNGALQEEAEKSLVARQDEVLALRGYLGDLQLTVTRDAAADTAIPAMPAPRPGPAQAPRQAARSRQTSRSAPAAHGPTLDKFYDHVVEVIATVNRGFERSPGRFGDADEETLRDLILVTLNSHYEGAATGETFNGVGKTDILVRHGIDNAFIGECKFWGGKQKLAATFDQLLSYTTWQDNRLAIVLFVRQKKLQPIIETAREYIAARLEFGGWASGAPDGQIRCALRWEDEARKTGRVTIFFVHLPA
jgi:hypothetical protein